LSSEPAVDRICTRSNDEFRLIDSICIPSHLGTAYDRCKAGHFYHGVGRIGGGSSNCGQEHLRRRFNPVRSVYSTRGKRSCRDQGLCSRRGWRSKTTGTPPIRGWGRQPASPSPCTPVRIYVYSTSSSDPSQKLPHLDAPYQVVGAALFRSRRWQPPDTVCGGSRALSNAPMPFPAVGEPMLDLLDLQACVDCELLFLFIARIRVELMLPEPREQHVLLIRPMILTALRWKPIVGLVNQKSAYRF